MQRAPASRHARNAASGTATARPRAVVHGALRGVAGAGDRVLPSGVQIARTVIWFSVSVPVLSEQTAVVLPSVSTAGSRRITARRRAIRDTPMARMMVTWRGQPLGDRADRQRHRGGERLLDRARPRSTPVTKAAAARARMTTVTTC